MAENTVFVDTAKLRTTSDNVKSLNDKLTSKLQEIGELVARSTDYYDSDSGRDMREYMKKMDSTFSHYKDIINEYKEFLIKAAQDYESTESTNIQNAQTTGEWK